MVRPSPMRKGGHRPEDLARDSSVVDALIFFYLVGCGVERWKWK
jgi:hypothetical protein